VKPLLYLLIGGAIGFWVGILPGIGGGTTLALMLPFIYKMTPQEAIPFLLGMHSVTATTGDITSVLFGIPGEATTVATVVDGFPMAKMGKAKTAIAASATVSIIGGLFSCVSLLVFMPVMYQIIFTLH
jgi:TctA family transporter